MAPDIGQVGATTPLTIGLVNAMPARGLRTAERQFRRVLAMAAGARPIELQLFRLHLPATTRLPERNRPDETAPTSASAPDDTGGWAGPRYQLLDALWDSALDGLIVTGMEPRAASLPEEPAWPDLVRIADWTQLRAMPCVWSCLAAHAVVLHRDGLARQRLDRKLSGLFACRPAAPAHPLGAGLPTQWRCPHSRHNELAEAALAARGYTILSRSDDAGVDVFARRDGAWSLFFQGHPEYDADSLLREYLRDVRRFLYGEQTTHPDIPSSYLDPHTVWRLEALRRRAIEAPRTELLDEVLDAARTARPGGDWHQVAAGFYRSWLAAIAGENSPAGQAITTEAGGMACTTH